MQPFAPKWNKRNRSQGACTSAALESERRVGQRCAAWQRRPGAKGRTLDLTPAYITELARPGEKHPPVSGRRGARPFLFQTLRGRQILQDSNDSDASDDNQPLQKLTDRQKLLTEAEAKEDSQSLEEFFNAETEDNQPLKKPDRTQPIG